MNEGNPIVGHKTFVDDAGGFRHIISHDEHDSYVGRPGGALLFRPKSTDGSRG